MPGREEWEAFKSLYVSPDGRVVDTANQDSSHSEGQGWGLILAEAFDDEASFNRILGWTRRELRRPFDNLHAWAWRPGRAPAMKPHVDHILCLLPFEPGELARLGGPRGTFVGHRLTADPDLIGAAAAQAVPRDLGPGREKVLLLLPGSRGAEVGHLLQPFGETVDRLRGRGSRLRVILPTLPRLRQRIEAATADWSTKPEIVVGDAARWQAFAQADAALIASGTVSLELALAGVPMVSCYKFDWLSRQFEGLITSWSALLPNLIADRPVAPEFYNRYVRPEHLARVLESLLTDTELRAWQRDGFAEVRRRLATERPPGELAASVVLSEIERKTGA